MDRRNFRNRNEPTRWPFLAFMTVVACLIYRNVITSVEDKKLEDNCLLWLKNNGLSFMVDLLEKKEGIGSFVDILQIDIEKLAKQHKVTITERDKFVKKRKALTIETNKVEKWLKDKGLEIYASGFYELGYVNIARICNEMQATEIKDVIQKKDGSFSDYQSLLTALNELKNDSNIWLIVSVFYFILSSASYIFKLLFSLFILLIGYQLYCGTLAHYHRYRYQLYNLSFSNFIGYCWDASSCKVEWLQNDDVVGCTASFIIKLYRRAWFFPYKIRGDENVHVEIRNKKGVEAFLKERYDKRRNAYLVTFFPKISGFYTISISLNGQRINGSPFKQVYNPGVVDTSKIAVLNETEIIVVNKGVYSPLKIDARDKYENHCELDFTVHTCEVHIKQAGLNGRVVDSEPLFFANEDRGRNVLHIKLEDEGCFHASITCQGRAIKNGVFDIVSLSDCAMEKLNTNTSRDGWHQTWYDGYLLPSDYDPDLQEEWTGILRHSRKIYFYFSSRQLTVKEFYCKIIPYRLYSFRISPSTKIILPDYDEDHQIFCVDDGIQSVVMFSSTKRSLILATFSRFLLRNIGGAETFLEKRRYFFKALQAHHSRNITNQEKKITIEVNRRNILESSFEATKNFSVSKWCRRFFIKFEGEPGLDAGGPSREWISILSDALFNPKNELFTHFSKEDKQSLICPNQNRPSRLKLKYYEFAGRIVGKCIFESSCSESRRLNIKARFMRSFLAQVIGLRVNFKYFKTDDKQLYSNKIKYIQEVDPEYLDLVFSEEEYDNDGNLLKEIDLIPNGHTIKVTENNKMKYLDALAQYKLSARVKTEIDAFIKGLNEIVPDNLITMFNEQELELLICGTSDISVNDLKKNHLEFASHAYFEKVMNWFWKAASLFNQDDFARLLQFTTGSSQLPPGGFSSLSPKFSFSSSPLRNALPKAHTCFNQLVLPDYSSCEEFQRCLHLALTEGCEGFSFE